MPHVKFNWIDVVFLTLLFRVSYIGFKNGALPEFFKFIGLLIAFLFSFNNYMLLSRFTADHTNWSSPKLDFLCFLAIFFGILLIFKALASIVSLFSHAENIPGISRAIGLLLGIGRGCILAGLIYTLLVNCPFEYLVKSAKERSFSGRYVSGVLPFIYNIGMWCYPWDKFDTPFVKALES